MSAECSDTSTFIQAFKKTLLFFVTLPLMPVVLFVTGLFWFYRICAIFIAWIFLPYLTSIVSPRDTLFAPEASKWSNNQVMVIPAVLVVDGSIEVEQLRDWFASQVIFVRKPDGSLKYPKLRRVQEQFLGFLWWKWDSTFDINYHIREYSSSTSEPVCNDLDSILTTLSNAPLPINKPAWDITIITNYKRNLNQKTSEPTQTAIFCRISHTYSDGHSLLRMMISHFKLESEVPYIPNPYSSDIVQTSSQNGDARTAVTLPSYNDRSEGYTFSEKTIFFAYLCMSFPHYLLSVIRSSYEHKNGQVIRQWPRRTKAEIAQHLFFTTTESYTDQKITETSGHLGVSVQTLMISAIAHGYSLSKMVNLHSQRQHIKISANFPWITNLDDDSLGNNWMEAFYEINLKQCNNLKHIQNIVAFLSSSPLLASNYYFTHLFYIFPLWILKHLFTTQDSHVNISCVRGPRERMAISEYVLDDFILCSSLPRKETGIGATVFSYNNSTKIILSAKVSQHSFSEGELQDLCNNINKCLKDLVLKS